MSEDLLAAVDFYTAMLAVPARRGVDAELLLQGRERFKEFNCDACHVRTHQTGGALVLVELQAQKIWPYTDLLLHDMGEGLEDRRPAARNL